SRPSNRSQRRPLCRCSRPHPTTKRSRRCCVPSRMPRPLAYFYVRGQSLLLASAVGEPPAAATPRQPTTSRRERRNAATAVSYAFRRPGRRAASSPSGRSTTSSSGTGPMIREKRRTACVGWFPKSIPPPVASFWIPSRTSAGVGAVPEEDAGVDASAVADGTAQHRRGLQPRGISRTPLPEG
ncbi:unnamed protein product, partial [Ixodes hexagonus]